MSLEVTRREAEVLDALGERLTNAEIAARLFISGGTVGSQVSSLVRRLAAVDRRALASIAGRTSVGSVHVPLRIPLALHATALYAGRSLDSARLILSSPGADRRLHWVRGEADIDKTRLLAALGKERHDEGAAVLERNGHHALAARTGAWWANSLTRRDSPGDHAHADRVAPPMPKGPAAP